MKYNVLIINEDERLEQIQVMLNMEDLRRIIIIFLVNIMVRFL